MQLNAEQIMTDSIAACLGLLPYGKIMDQVNATNVSVDQDFQRLFNSYYWVRRNSGWRAAYYTLFESMKTQPASFESILTQLYHTTGRIEASFSSKMLATLQPWQPLWDQHVLNCLSLQCTRVPASDKLGHAIALYEEIKNWYRLFLPTENAKECIRVFDRTLPGYRWLNEVKKIDLFLWKQHTGPNR